MATAGSDMRTNAIRELKNKIICRMIKTVQTFMVVAVILTGMLGFLNVKTVNTKSGNIRLVGKQGPPVLFQTGLFGTIPRFMYGEFTRELEKYFTMIYSDEKLLNDNGVNIIADAIGAEKIGLVTHSSLMPSLLTSDRIARSVLLDPVIFPAGFNPLGEGMYSTQISGQAPTRILRAGRSTNRFIPESFEVDLNNAEVVTFESAGHSDVLDDIYADTASKIGILGLAEGSSQMYTFDAWKTTPKSANIKNIRKKYRAELVDSIVSFFENPATVTLDVSDLSIGSYTSIDDDALSDTEYGAQ